MEICVHPYIPMIFSTSNQCGTLLVYPKILPLNDYPSAEFSPLYQLGFSAPMRWKHTPYMVAPPVSRACSIPGQLLFTVLGPGHVHEESGAHHLFNRAHPWA